MSRISGMQCTDPVCKAPLTPIGKGIEGANQRLQYLHGIFKEVAEKRQSLNNTSEAKREFRSFVASKIHAVTEFGDSILEFGDSILGKAGEEKGNLNEHVLLANTCGVVRQLSEYLEAVKDDKREAIILEMPKIKLSTLALFALLGVGVGLVVPKLLDQNLNNCKQYDILHGSDGTTKKICQCFDSTLNYSLLSLCATTYAAIGAIAIKILNPGIEKQEQNLRSIFELNRV